MNFDPAAYRKTLEDAAKRKRRAQLRKKMHSRRERRRQHASTQPIEEQTPEQTPAYPGAPYTALDPYTAEPTFDPFDPMSSSFDEGMMGAMLGRAEQDAARETREGVREVRRSLKRIAAGAASAAPNRPEVVIAALMGDGTVRVIMGPAATTTVDDALFASSIAIRAFAGDGTLLSERYNTKLLAGG